MNFNKIKQWFLFKFEILKFYLVKFFKYFQYAYLVFAILFIVEAVMSWETSYKRALLFIFLALVAVFMFFFKRYFGNKYNKKS